MKKRYIPMIIAICTILFLFSSCDGSVNEKLFAKDDTQVTPWPNPDFDSPVFVYADKDWNIIPDTETSLWDAFAKNDDGLSYDGTVVRYKSDDAKNIYINTAQIGRNTIQYVIIDAPNATIRHYGKAGCIEIQSAAAYYLYGEVKDLVVSKGKISIESDATVADFSVAKGATGSDLTIKVEKPEKVKVFAYYQSEADEVKVNGKDPSTIFASKSLAKISSKKNEAVARIGKNTYDYIPSSSDLDSDSDSDGVIRLVKNFTIKSAAYSLGSASNKGETLRVGAGVELTVGSANLTVYGTLENFGTIIVNAGQTFDVENELHNYGTFNNSGEVPIGATPSNPASLTNQGGTINNSGSVTVYYEKSLWNYGTFDNSGEVTVNSGGSLHNYGTITGTAISGVTEESYGN